MQQRVNINKVTTPHTNFTSLTSIWLQKLTQYQKKMTIIKLMMSPLGHIVDIVRLGLEFVEESL